MQAGTTTSHAGEPRADRNDNDIDRFMQRVLAQRDAAPWRGLGDFVLRETYSFELVAPPDSRLSSFRRVRQYEWYVREGTAVRSPVRVDGVGIDDETRRAPMRRRGCATRSGGAPSYEPIVTMMARRAVGSRSRKTPSPASSPTSSTSWSGRWSRASTTSSAARPSRAARSCASSSTRPAPSGRRPASGINRGIVKTSMVTLWVDPEIHQIVKYAFENAGLDFLRFRWLLRADGLQAEMELAPVRGVWMPARMTLSGRATTALGEYVAAFTQEFFDYRQAETGARPGDPESHR